jgi:flagellar motor switch protein FliN/FliY
MFTQDEIDAVLQNAQEAVDTLAEDVENLDTLTATPLPRSSRPAHQAQANALDLSAAPQRVKGLLTLHVPVVVRLAERPMSVNEILNMCPGTILEFDRTVDQELDLMISDCIIGSGVAVKIGEHFGLRITRIGNIRERIRSLGHG